jgi:hypothetical protein
MPTYLFGTRRVSSDDEGLATAVAHAYAERIRPRCLCLVDGGQALEMYIARLGDGFIVKRMPETGSHHAPDCPSYEPPPDASGLGQVLGTAIVEDPATGETTLKLDFPLSKMPGRSTTPSPENESDSAKSSGTKLSLRGLLHYLWDQAELTKWHPGFAGRRNWGIVRSHLLKAAEHKIARGDALRSRLYVPEVFSVEERDAINARRLAQWQHAVAVPGKPQHLMLLIGEVKEIVPARYGYKAVVKHVPDQGFAIDEQLYRRLGRRFETELTLWGSVSDVRMVMIVTFGIQASGVPMIDELALMPVTFEWLPVEDRFELDLVRHLVGEQRSFVKALRYNLRAERPLPTATLTDAEDVPTLLFTDPPSTDADVKKGGHGLGPASTWTWRPGEEMSCLPTCKRTSQHTR